MSVHKVYGNNKILCNGQFISGPDYKSSFASFTMILVPSVLWQIFDGPFYADRYNAIIPVFVGFMQVGSMATLLLTAFSDPGIMPRQKDYQEAYDVRTDSKRKQQPPRYHELVLRAHPYKLKYCTTCNIYRPPRTTHCSVCENCIERFDHHCPWLGNCIGKRNYWLFYSFVCVTGVLNSSVLGTSLAHVIIVAAEHTDENKGSGDAFLQAMREEPLSTALAVYAALLVWFTVGLCAYHAYLISTNQTTYENIKDAYAGGTNPFDRGILGNWADIVGSRVRPRYFSAGDGELCWPSLKSGDTRELVMPTKIGATSGAVKKVGLQAHQRYAYNDTELHESSTTNCDEDAFDVPRRRAEEHPGGRELGAVPEPVPLDVLAGGGGATQRFRRE